MAVLPFALAIIVALALLYLTVSLFRLPLLDFSLAALLSFTLLLLPGFVSLVYLFASLGTPNASFLALLLGPSRDRGRRRASLSRLLSLALLATFGSLFLTLLLAFGSLLLPLGLLLLAFFATLIATPLGQGIGAKSNQRNRRNAE